jgi:TRAP-type C4-dicarboxylate transport system permease small subunit
VEIGQVFVLLLAVPVLTWAVRRGIPERLGIIVVSAFIAHTAWHWTADRWSHLAQYEVRWPALDAAFAAGVMRWAMLALVCAGAAWALAGLFGRWLTADERREPGGRPEVGPAGSVGV